MIKRDPQFSSLISDAAPDSILVPRLEEEPAAVQFENTLRPKVLGEYIGQSLIKKSDDRYTGCQESR